MGKIADWDQGDRLVLFIEESCSEEDRIEYLKRIGLKGYLKQDFFMIIGLEGAHGYRCNPDEFDGLLSGDILSVSANGNFSVIHERCSSEIDIFMTNQCNSNCIMCPLPENVRKKKNEGHGKWLIEYINILPEDIGYINVTGGEPTLGKEYFIQVMSMLAKKFIYSDFQLLTNGRSVADKAFLQNVLNVCPKGMRFAIPLHASEPEIHDQISQSKGSFAQTDRGIRNLLKERQKVEIRIVVSKKNLCYLTETAQYIADNYKGLFCVNFIGMEMMGNAAINREILWVEYFEVFQKAKTAIDLLARSGIDVQLYNFPLCAVDRGYWHIAAKSITDYKVRFMDECEECSVKEICGGFFYSTKQVMNPKVFPIRKKNED